MAVFADPPFNLKKVYGSKSDDNMTPADNLAWSRQWIISASRALG